MFCLTFMVGFFGGHGFVEIEDTPVDHEVYEQLLQSYDEGVAEFLGLERVKPNTLGNHRMLLDSADRVFDQPVLRRPVAIPLIVTDRARLSCSLESAPDLIRSSSETCSECRGSR